MDANLTAFLDDLSTGASSFATCLKAGAELFMEPPFVVLPIAACVYGGYRLGMRVIRKIQKA